MSEEQKPQKSTTAIKRGPAVGGKSREYYLFAFKIMGNFGAAIAVPIVLFALVGQYLDGRYGKSPLFMILGFALAAIVSGKMIYKKDKQYGGEYKNLGKKISNN